MIAFSTEQFTVPPARYLEPLPQRWPRGNQLRLEGGRDLNRELSYTREAERTADSVFRTLARNFSADLDEMFKLNSLGALELSVEEKYAFSPTSNRF